jgi:hypothetical protein
MKSVNFLLAIVLPFLAAGAATDTAHAATCTSISCTGLITQVSVMKSGHSMGGTVRLDSAVAPSGCTLSGGVEWLFGPNDEALIRTLVAAHVAGRSVQLRRVDNVATCTVDYVTVY